MLQYQNCKSYNGLWILLICFICGFCILLKLNLFPFEKEPESSSTSNNDFGIIIHSIKTSWSKLIRFTTLKNGTMSDVNILNKSIKRNISSIWNNRSCDGSISYKQKPLNSDIFESLILDNNKPKQIDPQKMIDINTEIEYNKYLSLLPDKNKNFYNDLKNYHILLKLFTIQSNKEYFSYSINNDFYIYPNSKIIKYFCCNQFSKFGNDLSLYYGARSLAYWMNYNFIISCKSYYSSIKNKDKMTDFLPTNIKTEINNTEIINDDFIISFYPEIKYIYSSKHTKYIHPGSLIFLYYNPYFQNIIHYELSAALINYYKFQNNTNYSIMDKMSETNDVVIHIRCGDVLSFMPHLNNWGITDWWYGFETINYYRYIVENITNYYDDNIITNKTSIWILSQLTNKSLRKGDEQKIMNQCNFLINYIIDYGLKQIFFPAKINIVYDSDMNDDYYRMINAPLLICSPSTFCFNAGIANIDGIVIIPRKAPWFDLNIIDNKTNNNDDNDDFIVAKNSKLLPKNHIVIDTKKAKFHCNHIDESEELDLTKYTQKLAQYLVSH